MRQENHRGEKASSPIHFTGVSLLPDTWARADEEAWSSRPPATCLRHRSGEHRPHARWQAVRTSSVVSVPPQPQTKARIWPARRRSGLWKDLNIPLKPRPPAPMEARLTYRSLEHLIPYIPAQAAGGCRRDGLRCEQHLHESIRPDREIPTSRLLVSCLHAAQSPRRQPSHLQDTSAAARHPCASRSPTPTSDPAWGTRCPARLERQRTWLRSQAVRLRQRSAHPAYWTEPPYAPPLQTAAQASGGCHRTGECSLSNAAGSTEMPGATPPRSGPRRPLRPIRAPDGPNHGPLATDRFQPDERVDDMPSGPHSWPRLCPAAYPPKCRPGRI